MQGSHSWADVEESSSFPLGTIVARMNRWEKITPLGINLANGLLCGEKIILVILLGSNTLWEERCSVEMLVITPLGIERTLPRAIFRGF